MEFAIVVPIFFLLIFGIMEFGWAFFQKLDVRSGANEGARLAAVNYKTSAAPSPARPGQPDRGRDVRAHGEWRLRHPCRDHPW